MNTLLDIIDCIEKLEIQMKQSSCMFEQIELMNTIVMLNKSLAHECKRVYKQQSAKAA